MTCPNALLNLPIFLMQGDLKLIHRTQPVLGTIQYNFDKPKLKKSNPMSGKNKKTTMSRFGLPSEKVRNFLRVLRPRPMHWKSKIHPELLK